MKKPRTIQDICIQKIKQGIISLRTGKRNPNECEADIQFSFKKLKELNPNMFESLQMEYLIERIKQDKEIKECV